MSVAPTVVGINELVSSKPIIRLFSLYALESLVAVIYISQREALWYRSTLDSPTPYYFI